MRSIFIVILAPSLALAQGIVASGGNMTKGGNITWGATGNSNNQVVTINLGGTGVNTQTPDSGNALFVFATPFTTPATMSGPSWGNCNVYFSSPDATNKNWGCALYSDGSAVGRGYVNTQNAATGGCAANCVTWASGDQFTAGMVGQLMTIGGTNFTVSSFQSATVLTLGSAPGTNTAIYFDTGIPGSLICSAFSSTTAVAGWNSLIPVGCTPPVANTRYWAASITVSSTQANGRIQGNMPCFHNNMLSAGGTISQFLSNADWPPSFSTTTSPSPVGDGCIAAYMNLTYTTTAPYTVVSAAIGSCDSGNTTCPVAIPPTGANHTLIVWPATSAATGLSIGTPTNSASDSLSKRGTCPTVTGGPGNFLSCIYSIDRASTGVNLVTCNYGAANKDICGVVEVAGTASSSFDQVAYDSAIITSTPFTGTATSATAQATEYLFGTSYNEQNFTSGVGWNIPVFFAGGSWTLLGSGANSGNAPQAAAMYFQTVSSTGTYSVSGSQPGSNVPEIFTGIITGK